jgi:hypothetical protein
MQVQLVGITLVREFKACYQCANALCAFATSWLQIVHDQFLAQKHIHPEYFEAETTH